MQTVVMKKMGRMGGIRRQVECDRSVTIEARATSILRNSLGRERKSMESAEPLVFDLSGNSLESVEAILALEKAFHVEIPDEEALAIKTVAHLLALIRNKVGNATEGNYSQ